jgi:aminoglycoside phosphotransferase (APT) family kinase protein
MPAPIPRDDVTAVLARLVPRWDTGAIEITGRLPGGLSNVNVALRYGGRAFVLRICRPRIPGAIDRVLEYALLTDALSTVTAPLVAFALPEGHLLTRRVPGPLLADTTPSPDALARFVFGLHARLRRFGRPHPLVAHIRTWFDVAESAGAPADPAWRRALADLPPLAATAPCHNDLNPWNVVARTDSPRHWCTLDWEWCGDHDPLFDVVALCEGLELPRDALREVAERYARMRALDSYDAARLDVVRRWFHLREVAWASAMQARVGTMPEFDAQLSRSGTALAD